MFYQKLFSGDKLLDYTLFLKHGKKQKVLPAPVN